jgi:hypothetical protein
MEKKSSVRRFHRFNRRTGILWIKMLKNIEIIGKLLYLDGTVVLRLAIFNLRFLLNFWAKYPIADIAFFRLQSAMVFRYSPAGRWWPLPGWAALWNQKRRHLI